MSMLASSAKVKYLVLVVILVMMTATSFAQTQVPLEFDTNELFTQTNTWINTLWPVFAIGGAISIAGALITLVIGKIVQAFRS